MNLASSMPRRTISLAPEDADIPYASLFGPRKSAAEKERNRKRNIRKKSLRRQISHAERLMLMTPIRLVNLRKELLTLESITRKVRNG